MSSPMSTDENAFTPVDGVEGKDAYDDLVGHQHFVTGVCAKGTILLKALRIEWLRQILFLQVIEESALLPSGEVCNFSFHLETGEFQFEAPLLRDAQTPSIALASVALKRMQRRNNFRTPTGRVLVSFIPRKALASGKSVPDWHVLDVSVGGFAIAVKATEAAELKVGQHIDGTVKMPGREDLKVKAVVRHLRAMEHGTDIAVGLEVLEMDQLMQRSLLSMGLQIHRETKQKA
jgi:c-di-GMP-binding flagellar brake protein YcgR